MKTHHFVTALKLTKNNLYITRNYYLYFLGKKKVFHDKEAGKLLNGRHFA